jgi:hypothetical protein
VTKICRHALHAANCSISADLKEEEVIFIHKDSNKQDCMSLSSVITSANKKPSIKNKIRNKRAKEEKQKCARDSVH